MKPTLFTLAATFLMTTTLSVSAAGLPTPPDAAKKPHEVKAPHGAQRSDEYYWLRDDKRKNPQMLAYLNAENAYADAFMKPLKPLEDKLYDEIVGRIKQDDSSVPYRERGYWYYTRFETGQDYPIHARRKGSMDEAEQILLDVNAMAKGKDYFNVGGMEITQDNTILAWVDDAVGRRQYKIRFKNLATGEIYPEVIDNASTDLVWADDNKTLFYVENDPETLLTVRVKKHVLGTPAASDTLVYEEKDDSFYMGIGRTRDDAYLCISVHSTVSSETRCAPAADPKQFVVLAPRERDVEYDADRLDGRWVIRTNAPGADGKPAPNFKLVTAPDGAQSRKEWKDWIAHRDDVFIEGFELFDGFTAVAERSNALERLRLIGKDGKEEFVKADEPAFSMGLSTNSEHDTPWLRYTYTSLTTPATTYELNTQTGERKLLKRQPVIGFDADKYVTERFWATARDGVKVPVSLVYKKGFEKNGKAAMLQYAYGSYGLSMDPAFNSTIVSLLDRGMVYAIAHIRGGQEMGRKWYDDGKLFHKKNTFNDFIDVTEDLVKAGYAAPDRVAAYGGSAGGLLMGAISNMAPDKYRVVLSQVPFVDVVTTMLDASIPLTTNEYDEWGNPEKKDYYDYMLTYSPYDNLKKQAYPAMFVGTGLWDSQVQYWEPAKYVARLRDLDTGAQPVLFRTNMDAGHGGKSGRFRKYREQSEMYAFMIDQMQVSADISIK
ncbi:S9 family peptidase [Lysobacter gummosus]|uniref:S9 family peptidase n=1 Tax=Lysobacter gummosus TaxID=262324 RepID=A0ABY3XBL5_9GAMM|nr:S9 family peptidase [Lysobacter gummosus]ALN93419.1 prolyl oligopeptidase family protein [Lysobacter gummosus]UNP28884.1 S9 family peptidase [Lysobacter gummosus]